MWKIINTNNKGHAARKNKLKAVWRAEGWDQNTLYKCMKFSRNK